MITKAKHGKRIWGDQEHVQEEKSLSCDSFTGLGKSCWWLSGRGSDRDGDKRLEYILQIELIELAGGLELEVKERMLVITYCVRRLRW